MTPQTFNHLLICIDGLCWYIIKSVHNPSQPLTPWFITSDPVEHLWSSVRVGRHSGRRTNITALDAMYEMRKLNRSLSLDAADEHLLAPTVAHTRGKTLIPYPNDEIIYYGKDISISEIKTAFRRGFEQGKVKFSDVSGFKSTARYEDDGLGWFTEDEEESDNEQEIEEGTEEDVQIMNTNEDPDEHISATALMNDGRSRMVNNSRFFRLRCVKDIRLNLDIECDVNNDTCCIINIGKRGRFHPKDANINGPVRGEVMFLAFPLSDDLGEKSSVSYHPVKKVCTVHKKFVAWVKTVKHGVIVCKELH